MKNTTKNNIETGTFGRMIKTKDFLPRPDDLVLKEQTTKVTIVLKKDSVNFFKKEAARLHTSYQRMIRNLLHEYIQQVQHAAK